MRKSLTLALVTAAVLAGCASIDSRNPQEVASNVTVSRDDFKKVALYQGPRARSGENWFKFRAAQLYSGQGLTRQLVIETMNRGWSFYDTAYDSAGNRLEVKVLDRLVGFCSGGGGCTNIEVVAVNLPAGYLQAHLGSGVHIQISGRKGSTTVKVEPGYIRGFLQQAPFAR